MTPPILALAVAIATAPVSPPAKSQSGVATWYQDGPGYYGAVPSWHFGDKPYAVRVCRADDPTTCTRVVVRDFCGCGDRHGEATVIDLSPSAFAELAPLSRGVVRVVVTDMVLPETSTR